MRWATVVMAVVSTALAGCSGAPPGETTTDPSTACAPSPERCDGVDNDCDGLVDDEDDDVTDASTWFPDADGDGFGHDGGQTVSCARPSTTVALVAVGGDCNDTDASVHPGALELCNRVDDDCDAATPDEGVAWQPAETGSFLDLTADFAAGTPGKPHDFLGLIDGTLHVCPGTWFATLRQGNTDPALAVVGPGGSSVTVLDGGVHENGLTGWVSQGFSRIEGITFRNGAEGIRGSELELSDVVIEHVGLGTSEAWAIWAQGATASLTDVVVQDVTGPAIAAFFDSNESVEVRGLRMHGEHAMGLFLADVRDAAIRDLDLDGNRGTGLTVYNGGAAHEGSETTVEVESCRLVGHDAPSGGGLLALGRGAPVAVTLRECEVSNNVADLWGGGASLEGHADLHLIDTVFANNVAPRGGALRAWDGTDPSMIPAHHVTCTATEAGTYGFVSNLATEVGGGAIELDSTVWGDTRDALSSVTASACDFGTQGGGDDNAPVDILERVYEGVVGVPGPREEQRTDLGDDVSTCVGAGCTP